MIHRLVLWTFKSEFGAIMASIGLRKDLGIEVPMMDSQARQAESDADSDEALFSHFRATGDRAVLASLFERHVQTVAALCYRIISPALAEEAAQEVFLQVL